MTIKVSPQLREQILQGKIDYGLSGDIGGLPKTTYYTPDGRIIKTTANLHTNQAGQVRDANLDRGWLLSPPAVPKLFCRWCDKWHDTQQEVNACYHRLDIFIDKETVKAKQEETNEVVALKNELAEVKAMLKQLMEVKDNGELFQSEANEPAPVPSEQSVGAAKEGL